MKKTILYYVASILFFSSCNSDVPAEPIKTQDAELSFGISNATWDYTKGSDITSNNIKTMSVFGYLTSDSWRSVESGNASIQSTLFDKQLVHRKENGSWFYEPPKMWDFGSQHHFFAYAPAEAVEVAEPEFPSVTPLIQFEVQPNAIHNIDLLWGTGNLLNLTFEKNGSSPVDITFKHALTKITFAACMSQDYANTIDQIHVDSLKIHFIQIHNLRYSGHPRVTYNSDTTAIEGGEWLFDSHNDKLRDFMAHEHNSEYAGALEQDLWLTTEMQALSRQDGAFYMMPQKINPGQDELMPTMYVFFECKTINKILETIIPLPYPASGKWEPGQHIQYQFTYTGGAKSPYDLEAVVLPWKTQDIDVELGKTYLNLSSANTIFSAGSEHVIYYQTNFNGVVSAVAKSETETDLGLQVSAGEIILPASMRSGVYTIIVTARNLSRSMQVTIQ